MTMLPNSFKLIPANGFVWNQREFTEFLIANQGKAITVGTSNEGVCLESAGIYQQLEQFGYTDVVIRTSNLLEQHSKYKIKLVDPFKFLKVEHGNYQHLHTWTGKYKFACWYNRPLWHRLGLAAELQENYESVSLINLRADPRDPDQQPLFEVQQLFEFAPQSMKTFAAAISKWPRQVEPIDTYVISVDNTTCIHTDQLAQYYPDLLIDVVAETWTQGNAFYPTEKTVRPMLLKKPFIAMGSQDYLAYLRQLGFRTFADFWDETYDGYQGGERYSRILALIDQLSAKSTNELETMYWDMQYTLEHNYNLLTTQSYEKKITQL